VGVVSVGFAGRSGDAADVALVVATGSGRRDEMVVLINPFEVPAETSDEEFLAGWERAAAYLQAQPGFVGTVLHRALSPDDAPFRFVNVAEWESPQAFAAAVTSDGFRRLARNSPSPGHPALYTVVRTAGRQGVEAPTRVDEGVPA
jgi:heme-degrading monooxygenase HmoA